MKKILHLIQEKIEKNEKIKKGGRCRWVKRR